jgi:hypothetical protein
MAVWFCETDSSVYLFLQINHSDVIPDFDRESISIETRQCLVSTIGYKMMLGFSHEVAESKSREIIMILDSGSKPGMTRMGSYSIILSHQAVFAFSLAMANGRTMP